MRNGPYIVVKAPDDYPGRTYRGARRYVYEHHLVWWKETGQLVPDGYLLHHKDEDKTRNVFDNLELKTRGQHTADHNNARPVRHGTLTGYRRKCRCDSCRLAIALDMRKRRLARNSVGRVGGC